MPVRAPERDSVFPFVYKELRLPGYGPRRRWEDNFQMDLQEVGWGHGLDLTGSE